MAEALDTLIHHFTFTEEERSLVTLSDPAKIRLDRAGFVALKQDSFGEYPTDANLYVISPSFAPKAARQWFAFQAFIQHAFRGLTQLTGEGFRLHDGTNQWWHNGSTWVVNTTNWNTEAQVAANIAAFNAKNTRTLRIVVNLSTTDKRVTPILQMAKVAWKSKQIHYLEDIIYRSLVPALRAGTRFLTDFAFKLPFPGGSSLDVGAALGASGFPFNVVDVDSVFNHTTDPEHLNNVLSSYDPATKIATLSPTIPVGNVAFLLIKVEPEVAVETTSQDFLEVEKVPLLAITDIDTVESAPMQQDDSVVDKATGTAVRIRAPYRFDLVFTMLALAPGAVDLLRLVESVVGFMETSPTVRSPALDRSYRLWLQDEFRTETLPNIADLHQARLRFTIKDVLAWKRAAVTSGVHGVLHVKLRGDMDIDSP